MRSNIRFAVERERERDLEYKIYQLRFDTLPEQGTVSFSSLSNID